MAIELRPLPNALTQAVEQKPQLVLEIDGVTDRFGIGIIKKYVRIGDPGLVIGNDWTIGGFNEVDDQIDLISLDGTTTTIAQQLLQDKGGASSVSSIQISLIDKDGYMTNLITPGNVVSDILGRRANVYLGYQDTAFPQDFVQIFSGIIDDIQAGATVILNIAHPEAKKRVEIFQSQTTSLTSSANFRSETLQSIIFQTKQDVVGTVTVAYTGGGSAGSEVVTVVGNAISVQIQDTVSTASQIRNKLEASPQAMALVNIKIVSGQSSTPQGVFGTTSLNSATTINVESTDGFLMPADGDTLKTYIRIDNEIIEYTGMTATSFTGCTRAAFESENAQALGAFHESGTEVTSFYRLQGNALELCLKIMLSSPDQYFSTDVEVTNFQYISDTNVTVLNAIYFEGISVQDKYGIVVGDFITTSGDINAANNVTLKGISDIVETEFGSYIVVDDVSFNTSIGSDAVISFASKYNVLPAGARLELGGEEVDVPEFERINETYGNSIFSYDFYLTESKVAKDFLDQEVLYPTGAFSIPRKGKISVGYTSPPLAIGALPKFDSSNTMRPDANKISRSINRYFYNTVVFKYNIDPLESDRFLNASIDTDADSRNQIRVGNKVMTIEAKGLRPSAENSTKLSILNRRLTDRYKYAAESTEAKFFYGDSFWADVGDIVVYGDSGLNLVNTKTGTRGFNQRLFEVVNKSLDIKTGVVTMKLVDTNYLTDARYGVFGPASVVGSGSTTTSIKITNSFGTVSPKIEKTKWQNYIGQSVRIHSDDWTYDHTVILDSFAPGDNYTMQVSPALPTPPLAGYLVDMPEYPTGANDFGAPWRNAHAFFVPEVLVASGISATQFTVGAGDIGKFFVGSPVLVHNSDYSSASPEVTVSAIAGTTITVNSSLGFTPNSTYSVSLIGFSDDEGDPYRWI